MPGCPQTSIQRTIGSVVAAAHRADWYVEKGYGSLHMSLEERFDAFVQAMASEGNAFKEIRFQRHVANVILANQSLCQTEVVSLNLAPELHEISLNGHGKHVVYFTGMGSQYQDCFKDMATAVRITGATYHGFEYPGMRALGGELLEANDMVNTGIAVVNHLLQEGIAIDDIILQGDSLGSATAYQVKQQFMSQSSLHIRVIMNNTFNSFAGAICDVIGQHWYTLPLRAVVKPVLKYTGWDACPGDAYVTDTAYQMHVNHVGDHWLPTASLAHRVEQNEHARDFIDPCELEYKTQRDSLKQYRWATITSEGALDLSTRFGTDAQGAPNTHLADLSQLYYPATGEDAYSGLVVRYLQFSNAYVAAHPQVAIDFTRLPKPLPSEARPLSAYLSGFFSCGRARATLTQGPTAAALPAATP